MHKPQTDPQYLPSLPWLIVLLSAAAFSIGVHLLGPALPYDDAFITYRYVDNFLAGHGLVYNVGERVFGSSTPGYVFWLAGLKSFLPEVPTPLLAVRSNLLLFLLAAGALFALTLRIATSRNLAAALAALFLVNPQLLAVSLGGMETIGAVGLALAAAAGALGGRPLLFGLTAGLAMVTRPEVAVLLAPFVWPLWQRVAGTRQRVLALGLAALPGLAWVIFGLVYFGSPVPHSVLAKSAPLYPLPAFAALTRIGRWAGTWLTPGHAAWPGWVGLSSLGLLLLTALAGVVVVGQRRIEALGALYLLLAPLALYAVGNPLFFEWYWPMIFGPALLVLGAGGHRLAVHLARYRGPLLHVGWAIPALLAAITAGHYAVPAEGMAEPIAWQHIEQDPTRLRIVGYRAAAEALNERALPGETVAAPEIGALGYFFDGRLSDACGLVSPEAVPFLPVPAEQRLGAMFGAISVEFVQATSPDWVATMPVFALRSLLASPWFQENYIPVAQVPLPSSCWGSKSVVLFRRK